MLPIILKIGPITIYSFGFFLAIGLLVSSFVTWKEARLRGLSEEKVIDTFLLTTIFSLLASRLGYVFLHWSFFLSDPGKIFFLWKYPGLTLEGALVGGLLFAVLSAAGLGLSAWEILDIFSLSVVAGSVAGFFGCFLDHCLIGPVWLPLVPFAFAVLTLIILLYIVRQLRLSASLSKLGKTPGLLFLSYLIFQSFSLLILSAVYGLVTVLAIIVFVVRYPELIKIWLNFLATFSVKLRGIWKPGGPTSKVG